MTDTTDKAIGEEILNTINVLNFPKHKLALKIGMPVMLLRNLCLRDGLANGTKLLIREIQPNTIQGEILNGPYAGTIHMIPRVTLIHEPDMEFSAGFSRFQYPIVSAFALTINKCQGQSLDKVGLFLPRSVFGHGQLYVGMSRVTSCESLGIGLLCEEEVSTTLNVVNKHMSKK
jgi:ATP-dependent DNA helicase PIF1